MENSIKICRLCLEVVSDCNFETLDAVKLEMLKILRLNLSRSSTADSAICSNCSDKLQCAFDFKMTCLNNNDYLKTFAHANSNIALILEEIIVNELLTRDEVKREEEKVCRFCLKYFGTELFTKLNKLEEDLFLKDMVEKCLPEMDLHMTKVPLICCSCMDALQIQFNFTISCVDADERIKSYTTSVRTNNNHVQIQLSDVLNFDSQLANMDFIKLENESENGTDSIEDVKIEVGCEEDIGKSELLVKVEKITESDGAHEEVMSEGCVKIEESVDLGTMLDDTYKVEHPSFPEPETLQKNANGMFVCTFCSHQTNRRDSLVTHFSKHKKQAESIQFKCDHCSFVTKWKSSLTSHHLLHKNQVDVETYYCAKCPYKSIYKKHVRRHCKTHMNSEDILTYPCQLCPLTTKNKYYLKLHYKNKHKKNAVLPETILNCSACDYQTKNERNLDNHIKMSHNIVKEVRNLKYACESCDFRTHKLYHLQMHSLKHKSADEVEMFDCPQCSFQTRYKNSLKKHIKSHQPGKKLRQRKRTGERKTSKAKAVVNR